MVGIVWRKSRAGLTHWGEEWQEVVKRTKKKEELRRNSRKKMWGDVKIL